MNFGKFFRLNNVKSNLSEGIAVFDYIWLHDADVDKSAEYPVYLTITRENIDFHVHYHFDGNKDRKHISKHLHNTILSLPLSSNIEIKDGLTGTLAEGFKTNFPKFDYENSYLWKLYWKTIWKNRDWYDSDINYFSLESFVVCDNKEKTWKELIGEAKSFDDESSYFDSKNKENEESDNKEPEEVNRFIRDLILNFIFDLEQTKVFQTSPQYEYISVKLKENYFFNALAAKANFYYWREIIKQETNCPCNNGLCKKHLIKKLEENSLSVYIEYYLKAKMQWEKVIRSPKAEENFNGYEDKWFDDPEIEMNNVRLSWWKKKNSEKNKLKKIDQIIFKWVEDNKYFEKKGDKPTEVFTQNFIERFKQNKNLSDKFQKSHYYFWYKGLQLFIIPRLFISTAAAWLTFILGSGLWGNVEDDGFQKISNDNSAVWIFCICLIAFSYFWILYLGTKHKVTKLWHNIKIFQFWVGSLFITFLGFFYSFLIGGLLSVFLSHKGDNDVNHRFVRIKDLLNDIYCSIVCPCYEAKEELATFFSTICIAMFVGLVVQSFMDKQSPTEEL
jgi:hypothetical protein